MDILNAVSMWCGVILGPFFIAVFLIEGMFRADYQPLRQPVSALAIGLRGYVQRANFYITGALALMYSLGLYLTPHTYNISFWIPLLIAIFGVGLLGAGWYVTDITGLGIDLAPKQRNRNGVLHDIFSFFVFSALLAASLVFAKYFSAAGESGWALYSITSATMLVLFFILAGAGFARRGQLAPYGGLAQRISIITGWMWLSAVAAHILRIL